MVWERAALEAAETEAHEHAEELSAEIARIQEELGRTTERIENDLAIVTARLWGRVGALRTYDEQAPMLLGWANEFAFRPATKEYGLPYRHMPMPAHLLKPGSGT